MAAPTHDRPMVAPAAAIWDVLESIEQYAAKYRLTPAEGSMLLEKLLAVETVIKAQSAPEALNL